MPKSKASDILLSRSFGHVVRWTIVLALWTMLISMAIGQFGISNYIQLTDNAENLRERNMLLSIENQMIEAEIKNLQVSKRAQILYLAKEFGITEPGVAIVHLKPIPKHPTQPSETSPEQANRLVHRASTTTASLSF
jgi:cell division protein FtsB